MSDVSHTLFPSVFLIWILVLSFQIVSSLTWGLQPNGCFWMGLLFQLMPLEIAIVHNNYNRNITK